MSTALRIAHGAFGRVALLDMDRSLVRHAHPHCHVLIKADGADTQFSVGDTRVPLTDTQAVLINTWEPHAYVHDRNRPRTIILALYIEPAWLKTFRPNWAASGAPGFFERPAGEVSPRIRRLAMDLAAVMMADPSANSAQEQLLSDLMISVIERFTPWRTLSRRLQDIDNNRSRFDWRVRRAINLIQLEPQMARDVDLLAKEFWPVARAFLPPFRALNLHDAACLSQSATHGAGGKIGGARRRQPVGRQRQSGLHRARSFYAVFPRSCRRQSQRIPAGRAHGIACECLNARPEGPK